MPIRPENMARYPGGSINSPEWQAIRAFMRARAGDRCEGCGVRHLTYGVRHPDGSFTDLGRDRGKAESDYLMAVYMTLAVDVPNMIRIVCTVAHVDHGLDNHHTSNLRFWCQRCHLSHDAEMHAVSARVTRAKRMGQGMLNV